MANIKKLTLLHSNDMHGDFLPKEKDGKKTGGIDAGAEEPSMGVVDEETDNTEVTE